MRPCELPTNWRSNLQGCWVGGEVSDPRFLALDIHEFTYSLFSIPGAEDKQANRIGVQQVSSDLPLLIFHLCYQFPLMRFLSSSLSLLITNSDLDPISTALLNNVHILLPIITNMINLSSLYWHFP